MIYARDSNTPLHLQSIGGGHQATSGLSQKGSRAGTPDRSHKHTRLPPGVVTIRVCVQMHTCKRANVDQHVCFIDLTQAREAAPVKPAEKSEPDTSDAPADVEQVGLYVCNDTVAWLCCFVGEFFARCEIRDLEKLDRI